MRHLLKNKALWSLTLGHFAIDLFSGALPIVLLYLKDSLNLSLEQVGVVIGLYSISTSLAWTNHLRPIARPTAILSRLWACHT